MAQEITTRLIKAYELLRSEGHVRSARQFALSIGTYAQSFNEVLKGRREATLGMVEKTVHEFPISAHFLLTGEGDIFRKEVYGVSVSPTTSIRFIRAHEFGAYAAEKVYGESVTTGVEWQLPQEMIGQHIDLAVQCDSDRLLDCIRPGDTLLLRLLGQNSWKSNLSSKRIYALIYQNDFYLVRIKNNDANGIFLDTDNRALPALLEFDEIQYLWSVSSYLSSHCMISEKDQPNWSSLNELILAQSQSIQSLQTTIADLTSQSAMSV